MPKWSFSVWLLLCTPALAQPVTVVLEPVADNTLYEDQTGSLSNGSGDGLIAGTTAFAVTRRALLRFDLAGVVPPGSTITAASLQLTVKQTSAAPQPYDLHAVSVPWGEGPSVAPGGQGAGTAAAAGDATWVHTFFPSAFWSAPGGDFTPTILATATAGAIGDTPSWTSAALAARVQAWLAAPASNHGLLLKTADETVIGSTRRFGARERSNPAERPRLTVTYAPPAASVISIGTGCPASSGAPTTLGTVGLPQDGNAAFALILSGPAPGSAVALWLADGLASTPLALAPGCALFLDPASTLANLATGAAPIGPLPLPATAPLLPVPLGAPSGLAGYSVAVQAIALENGLLRTSNALDLVFGL